MKQILKYNIALVEGIQEIEMPFNAEILTSQLQRQDRIVIWAKIIQGNKPEKRYFLIILTGEEVSRENELKYISTIQMSEIVLHIFEVLK